MWKLAGLLWLRFKRRLPLMFGLSVVATVCAGAWWENDQFNISDAERGAYDDGIKKFTGNEKPFSKLVGIGRVTKSKDIIIIGIDNRTFREIEGNDGWRTRYGSVPYDRRIWADVLTYLDKVHAKAAIFDSVTDTRHADVTGDLALGETLATLSMPVYFGFATTAGLKPLGKVEKPVNRFVTVRRPVEAAVEVADAGEGGDFEFPEEPTAEEAERAKEVELESQRQKAAVAFAFPVVANGLTIAEVPETVGAAGDNLKQFPIPTIAPVLDVAAGFGLVTMESDEDGKLRRTAFAYTDGENNYVTLPVAVAADVFGATEIEISPGALKLGDRVIPINPDGTAEIDYGGQLFERFDTRSLVDVIRYSLGAPGGEVFKDKYVFIASLTVGEGGDMKATPLEAATPGVVKQASLLQNLLDGSFILTAPSWVSYLFAFFVAFFSVSLVLVIRNTFVDIGWPVLLYVGFFLITGSFLVATKVHVLSALPGLAGTIASVFASTWERLFARKERDRLKEMFSSYMEADLVDLMVEQKKLPSLEGENMVVTAFFSDIKGFSTFSEKFREDPHKLMRLLNRYLSAVTPVLTGQGACIDKYIGDAVVALFGAPVQYSDHALRACRGALLVQKAIGSLREDFHKEGLPDVYTRIGLNTDTMVVGNIGSEQLLDYTAIGDGMNLAARLEGANKEFGTLIMIGPGTYEAVRKQMVTRELDAVRVAGKTQAVNVYELICARGELSKEKERILGLYASALELYRNRKFEEAAGVLQAALLVDEADGPSKRLHAMCLELSMSVPAPDWEPISELSK